MKKLILILLLAVTQAHAARDIKIIVPYSAGGSTDRVARELVPLLHNSEYNFIIDYKLGAAGSVAANYVAQTKKETVLMVTSNGLVGNPILSQTQTYDLDKDFILVGYLGTEPLLLVVNSQTRISTFAEFLNFSKTSPMPYGSGGVGTSAHLIGAIISNNNPNMFHVPYKGGVAVVADIIGGNLKWTIESNSALWGYVDEKRLTALAVSGNRRLAQYPNVPTLREVGVDDRHFYRWHILVSNSQADPEVLKYLNRRLSLPEVQRKIEEIGLDPTQPLHIKTFFKTETEKTQKIIRDFQVLR